MSWITFVIISINLLFGYLVYLQLNRNGRHLLVNRWYLILFPLLSIALGTIHYQSGGSVFNELQIELPLIEINASPAETSTNPNINWLLIIYTSGAIFSLLHLGWSLIKIRKPKDAKFLNQLGNQRVYLISTKSYSYSHFNSIYISDDQLSNAEFILDHELAHCHQKHSFDILFVRLLRCVFWFNPVIYLWESKMKENHEYLADRVCIDNRIDVQTYSYALLSTHLGVTIPDLANGFNQKSLLRKRIIQLKTHNTFNMKKFILIPVVVAGTVMTMSLQLASKAPTKSVETHNVISKGEVESQPEFVGGMTAMITYFQDNIIYPKSLANQNIQDKVFVKFTVTETGKVQNVSLARGSEHEAFNVEAMRVISIMPDWKPGMKDGKAVSAEVKLPIQFAL